MYRDEAHRITQRQLTEAPLSDTLFRAMNFEPFVLERWQSIWENRVAWNLSESGVHPLRVE